MFTLVHPAGMLPPSKVASRLVTVSPAGGLGVSPPLPPSSLYSVGCLMPGPAQYFITSPLMASTLPRLPGTLASASASRMEVGSCTPMHLEASVQSAVGPSTRFVVAASARPKLVPASVVELPPVGMEPTMYPFTHTPVATAAVVLCGFMATICFTL